MGGVSNLEKQKEFVEYVLKLLVDFPEELEIDVESGEKSIVFKVKANLEDYGKIIGRRGKSINAVRVLLSVVSRDSKKRCVIDVLDKEERGETPAK